MEKDKNGEERERESFPNGQPGREVVSLDEHFLLGTFSSASGVPQIPFPK